MRTMSDDRIDETTRLVRSDEPVAVEVDGTVVMMSVMRGNYYGLDPVGSRIWELLESPHSVAELCAVLEREFDVPHETCRRDVIEFVQQLAAERLVDVVPPPSA